MLGITVLPEYIQSEGVEGLLDNLQKHAPVTAISTSPYVMAEASPEQGGEREPPADAGKGLARLLDRPLWGKNEVWVTAAPSFKPDLRLYSNLRYKPSEPTELTDREGHVLDDFIAAAHSRNIKVYFQVQAAIPPGYRVQFGGPIEDDIPRLPDGSIPPNRLDKNGSLASPHILDYGQALIRDLLQRYPEIDGIRLDWPEYPPYFLESLFLDFNPHVKNFAAERNIDFESIRSRAASLYNHLKDGITDQDLDQPAALIHHLQSESEEWRNLKTALVVELLTHYRSALDEAGGKEKELIPSAFPWPWNEMSGFDYAKASEVVSAISCKYYTMHWPMMLKNYAESLSKLNPNLSDRAITRFFAEEFKAAHPTPNSFRDFSYPEPNEIHPVDTAALSKKQSTVESLTNKVPIWPIAHSYGPTDDFIKRAKAVYTPANGNLWINRYAYLSNQKLAALGRIFK